MAADAFLAYFVRQNRGNDEAVSALDHRRVRALRVGFPENFIVRLAEGRHGTTLGAKGNPGGDEPVSSYLLIIVGRVGRLLGYASASGREGELSQIRCIHHATILQAGLADSGESKRPEARLPVLRRAALECCVAGVGGLEAARKVRSDRFGSNLTEAGEPCQRLSARGGRRWRYWMTSMQQPLEQYESAGQVPPAPQVVAPLGQVWPLQVGGSVLGS